MKINKKNIIGISIIILVIIGSFFLYNYIQEKNDKAKHLEYNELITQIIKLFENGNTNAPEALAYADKAINLLPKEVIGYSMKVGILESQEKFEEALAINKKIIELDPNDPDVYFDRARELNALGRYDEAIQAIDVYLIKNNDDVEANIEKGYALVRLKKCAEAFPYFGHASNQDPQNKEAEGFMSAILNAKDEECIDRK